MVNRSPRFPSATYRVQLTKEFTFVQAAELVGYWHDLQVTDLYASPFLTARPGSVHGYDVIDHNRVNPEIGSEEELGDLHQALSKRGMGLIMDVVPNHMCVNTNDNAWWNDVLENGPASPHAKYFDIDWRPPKVELANKVLLPVLGDQYGKVLESGELQLREQDGAFSVAYYDHRYPTDATTDLAILERAVGRLPHRTNAALVRELESIIDATRRRVRSRTAPDREHDRGRDKQEIKVRLAAWLRGSPEARNAVDDTLRELNGTPGQPRSFDQLEKLLALQSYRLSYWRVAAEQINYRRFFEINDLAAIRIEEPEVFDAVHARPLDLLARGWVTGLRIDHVDGLREPRRYLQDLDDRTSASTPYVIVEKILAPDERLPRSWATEGTTGYEFLNIVNGLFVSRTGEKPLRAFYDGLRTVGGTFEQILYQSKRLILRSSMASELSVLARRLARISEQHRWSRDFTIGTLEEVLANTIACFPVYRTYVGVGDVEVSPQDHHHVRAAIAAAQRFNPGISSSAFTFLGDVLLMRDPEGIDDRQRGERRDFILRFQQLTGPVMAKGLEDTTFYRYFPLLSLNEVGGGPHRFGLPVEEFHRLMEERARERPGGLSATSTHDTKRGEDSRARLDVLTELPEEWIAAVETWRRLAERLKTRVEGQLAPDPDDEYYIYQTLVAALPLAATGASHRGAAVTGPPGEESPEQAARAEAELEAFRQRAAGAVEKAIREAKRNTTWINPNGAYEDATRAFVDGILDARGPLLASIRDFVRGIATAGMLNSLAQLVVKVTAPGVPDFYQGTELWDFSMVDPDNRRPVEFARRKAHLSGLRQRFAEGRDALLAELWAAPEDGRIKLMLTYALLGARRDNPELFTRGAYLPLVVEGERREQVIAFARRWQTRVAVVVVGRFFARLLGANRGSPDSGGDSGREATSAGASSPPAGLPELGPAFARCTALLPPELHARELRDVITGGIVDASEGRIELGAAFKQMPFAVLVGEVVPPQDVQPREQT